MHFGKHSAVVIVPVEHPGTGALKVLVHRKLTTGTQLCQVFDRQRCPAVNYQSYGLLIGLKGFFAGWSKGNTLNINISFKTMAFIFKEQPAVSLYGNARADQVTWTSVRTKGVSDSTISVKGE